MRAHMFRLVFIIALVSASTQFCFAQLPHYRIQMDPALYDTLYMRDIFNDDYLPTQIVDYQGTIRTDAQIKFKGHSTRYYPKKSYRLKFGANFQGVRQINFNSMYTDKSFIRESMAWLLYADVGELAPSASHIQATINDTYKGVFLQVDKVDKYFLQKRGRTLAPMYEADDYYVSADLTVQPDSILKLHYAKEIGDANDYSDLRQMILTLNGADSASFPAVFDTLFDQRSVLNWFAVNTLVMQGDSYNKNYFIYHDTTKSTSRWTVIPWDYDLSFGRTGDESIPYPGSLLNDRFAYTFGPLAGPYSALKQRFMDSPVLMERLRSYLDSLLTNVWTEARLHQRIDSLAAVVDPYVEDDPDKWGTYDDFREHVEALKYYITARRNFLIATFTHPVGGQYNMVMLHPTQLHVPYHGMAIDGRQVATLTFDAMEGLDSILVRAHPRSVPPGLPSPPSRAYINRWLEVTPYPSTAHFTARLQWMWMDYDKPGSELSSDLQNERLLSCNTYTGGGYNALLSQVNAFGNFVNVDQITEAECGTGKHFAVLMPVTYTQKWFRHPSSFWQRWYGLTYQQNGRLAIVGDHGTAITSLDSGRTWSEHAIGINLPFFAVRALEGDTLIASGEVGALYRSANFGTSWTGIPLGERRSLYALALSPDGTLWAAGKGLFLRSSDRGSTWMPFTRDSVECFRGIVGFSAASAVAVGDSGRIASTSDGGLTWETALLPADGRKTLRHIASYQGKYCWTVGDSGVIYASVDSGKTWTQKQPPVMVNLRSVYLVDSNRVYTAGEGGTVFYSPDGGTHWYRQYTADAHDLSAISFADASHGIAVGNGGTILLTSESGTVTSVTTEPVEQPGSFVLMQNYPNPFNPVTMINYTVGQGQDLGTLGLGEGGRNVLVQLTVYDILGREVRTLVNEPQKPGRYQVRFNGAGLSSGVYFYRLTAGSFMQTRRMMLLK